MNRNRLLIIASYWNEDDVALFIAEHDEQPDKSFEKQLGEAFFAWAQTEEGRRFVESSGCNWGDALEIPDEILVKHGIHRFEQLLRWPHSLHPGLWRSSLRARSTHPKKSPRSAGHNQTARCIRRQRRCAP